MSNFTPSDAEHIKDSVRKIIQLTAISGIGISKGVFLTDDISDRDAELMRLFAFINDRALKGLGK